MGFPINKLGSGSKPQSATADMNPTAFVAGNEPVSAAADMNPTAFVAGSGIEPETSGL